MQWVFFIKKKKKRHLFCLLFYPQIFTAKTFKHTVKARDRIPEHIAPVFNNRSHFVTSAVVTPLFRSTHAHTWFHVFFPFTGSRVLVLPTRV